MTQAGEPCALPKTHPSDWGIEGPGLQLAISLGGASTASDWQNVLGWVDRAEALGLHSVWIPEMHFAPNVTTSPLLILAACAARTEKLRLGTTSLLLPIRPPLRLAEEAAALDRLSQGRLILGLGRGFRAPLFHAFGIDVATKRERFDASLDLMLARWAGESVSLVGTPFEHEDDPGDSESPEAALPAQRPHPPLAVAAFGRLGLKQAARRGLPYLASPLESLDLIVENNHFHKENLPAGTCGDDLVVPIMRTVYAAADDAEAARVMEVLTREAVAGRRLQGSVPKAIARAAEANIEERVVVGTRNQVADQLARYRERLGMHLLVARPQVANTTPAEREAALERLALDIVPEL